jgi:hypothetical protein
VSTAARLRIDPDERGITRADWDAFAYAFGLEFSPRSISGNLWYCGDIECSYGRAVGTDPLPDEVHEVGFSTYSVHVGNDGGAFGVAHLALAAWRRWPSAVVTADPEVIACLAVREHGR